MGSQPDDSIVLSLRQQVRRVSLLPRTTVACSATAQVAASEEDVVGVLDVMVDVT